MKFVADCPWAVSGDGWQKLRACVTLRSNKVALKVCVDGSVAATYIISEMLSAANVQSMNNIQDLFKMTVAEFMEGSLEAYIFQHD